MCEGLLAYASADMLASALPCKTASKRGGLMEVKKRTRKMNLCRVEASEMQGAKRHINKDGKGLNTQI